MDLLMVKWYGFTIGKLWVFDGDGNGRYNNNDL
jgi:hypothetical protein